MNPVVVWRIVQAVLAALAGGAGIIATHLNQNKNFDKKFDEMMAKKEEQEKKTKKES